MLNQVYRLVSSRQFVAQTVDEKITEDKLVVRPLYLSLCHADQRYFTGNRDEAVLKKKLPMALVHEAVGEVVYDPKGEIAHGTHVSMIPNTPTKHDPVILDNYLTTSHFRSSGYDGFMQEYVVLDRDCAVILPENIDLKMAAYIEMVSVGVHALTRLEHKMNANRNAIGVWGDGNLGYIVAVLAKIMFPESKLYVFGRHEYKLEYFSFADETYKVDAIPADLKIDHALECTGGIGSQKAINQIIDHINPMGTVIMMGVSEEPIAINTRMVLERGLTMVGSSRSNRADFQRAVEILSKNPAAQERFKKLIGIVKPVSTIKDIIAFFEADLANSWGKAVMKWDM